MWGGGRGAVIDFDRDVSPETISSIFPENESICSRLEQSFPFRVDPFSEGSCCAGVQESKKKVTKVGSFV